MPQVLKRRSESSTETEADLSGLVALDVQESVVFSTDWTTETLCLQLAKGAIDLDPAFQRRDAWTTIRKSKFIESIILGLPIPQIVLAEKKGQKGSFIVIDGKQRLLSVLKFTTDDGETKPFALSGLKLLPELNGVTFSELKTRPENLRRFENQPLRTVIIRNWQAENVLYLIFHRLNSETLPLSTQELRQALHPGSFLTFADKYSFASIGLRRTLGLQKPDFRMRDVELLVRLYAFRNFGLDYSGDLKTFLDDTCKKLNAGWSASESLLRAQAEDFENAITLSFRIFGQPFRKWDGTSFEKRFNRAIFDVLIYYFSMEVARNTITDSMHTTIVQAFKSLCVRDADFVRSIETTTKSRRATATRFEHWGKALSVAIGVDLPLLELRGD